MTKTKYEWLPVFIARACKLILAQDYTDIQEAFERLNILSFDQIIFLIKPNECTKFTLI